jgi:hypothetical protein
MATYVIVHGAFLGGWRWRSVANMLRAAGHEVYTPTLTGFGERAHLTGPQVDLNTHIQDVVGVLACEDLREVVPVGHSYGSIVTIDSIAFRYITANSHPDHDTIASFRRRFLPELTKFFVQILEIASHMKVLKLGTVSLDGTKVKANASKHKAFSYDHASHLSKINCKGHPQGVKLVRPKQINPKEAPHE